MTGDIDLRDRIRQLETELAGLWRRLVQPPDGQTGPCLQVLEVVVHQHRYLLPIEAVVEVLQVVLPVPIPDCPAWMPGSFVYAGAMVPMIDLGCRLSGRSASLRPEQSLVVVGRPLNLGLVVDEVGSVLELAAEELAPPPAGITAAPFLVGTVCRGTAEAAHLLSIIELTREHPGQE